MTERCRECAGGIFTRRRTGARASRTHAVSRYPPDGSLRPGERLHCVHCGTPHAVRYNANMLRWRLKQDGPPERRRAFG